MTEREWSTCGSRVHMRRMLRQKHFAPLRWINFNLACVQRVHELIDDERCVRLIRRLENCSTAADVYPLYTSVPNPEELGVSEAIRELWSRRGDPLRGARIAAARAVLRAKWPNFATSEMVALAVARWRYGAGEERRAHCRLLRDIFGNPFRPVAFSPQWRTDTALLLARQMYEAREFSAMPILADALQDAGCDEPAILGHCRDTSLTHVRGCWVTDLVLGKE